MTTVFLACAVLGGGVLVLQLVLSMLGIVEHELGFEHGDMHAGETADSLNLKSLRALSAGLGFFGIGGLFIQSLGLSALVGVPVGLAVGLAAAAGVAVATRAMLRFESDGSLQMHNAIGEAGRVYLSIPGGRSAPGKVHLAVQGRTVECMAVSEQPLATGAQVVVVGVLGPDTVEVAPSPSYGGLLDVPS